MNRPFLQRPDGRRAPSPLVAVLALMGAALALPAHAFEGGVVGRSGNPNPPTSGESCSGAKCHGTPPSPVNLDDFVIQGPSTVIGGVLQTGFRVRAPYDAGKFNGCGFNLSAEGGALFASDPQTRQEAGEITHSQSIGACSGIPFEWIPPQGALPFNTLFWGAGIHTDGSGDETGDRDFVDERFVTVVQGPPELEPLVSFLSKDTSATVAPCTNLGGASGVVLSRDEQNLYVIGENDESISVFGFNQDDGSLLCRQTLLDGDSSGGSTVDGMRSPLAMDASPGDEHIYVVGNSDVQIAVFERDAGLFGRLAFVEAPNSNLRDHTDLEVNAAGDVVYVVAEGDGTGQGLSSFSRDPVTGGLTRIETIRQGGGGFNAEIPDSIQGVASYDPGGNYEHVYTTGFGPSRVGFVRRDKTTNLLEGVAGLDLREGTPLRLAVSPDGRYVYGAGDNKVWVFVRDTSTGMLTRQQVLTNGEAGLDFSEGIRDLFTSPDGFHLYVLSDQGLAVFAKVQGTDFLEQKDAIFQTDSGVDGLDLARGMDLSPDGSILWVAARDATGSISSFDSIAVPEPTALLQGLGALGALAGVLRGRRRS